MHTLYVVGESLTTVPSAVTYTHPRDIPDSLACSQQILVDASDTHVVVIRMRLSRKPSSYARYDGGPCWKA